MDAIRMFLAFKAHAVLIYVSLPRIIDIFDEGETRKIVYAEKNIIMAILPPG